MFPGGAAFLATVHGAVKEITSARVCVFYLGDIYVGCHAFAAQSGREIPATAAAKACLPREVNMLSRRPCCCLGSERGCESMASDLLVDCGDEKNFPPK